MSLVSSPKVGIYLASIVLETKDEQIEASVTKNTEPMKSFVLVICCCPFKNFAYFAFQPQQERGKMTIFNICKLQFKKLKRKFLFSTFKSFGILCPLRGLHQRKKVVP